MFDKVKDIDAVTISTPDHMHAIQAIAAVKRINVYVQKPLTHSIREANVNRDGRENKIVTQMGNQGASNSGMTKVQSGLMMVRLVLLMRYLSGLIDLSGLKVFLSLNHWVILS